MSNQKQLAIGTGDIQPILVIVRSYRTYLRKSNPATYRSQLQMLGRLHQRLQGLLLRIHNGEEHAALPLTLAEWQILHEALCGWIDVIRRTISPSAEREMVIASIQNLARDVAKMLAS